MKRTLMALVLAASAVLGAARQGSAATVTVDPGASWLGFMNVFNLPSAGGAYQFGSSWGTADLTAVFSGPNLTLGPNTIGDPNSYWYTPSGGPGATGNKIMEANMYLEPAGSLPGQTVTFTGNILSNTLVSPYTSVAFIKDFAPDYSSSITQSVPLTSGVFSVSLNTIPDPNRHVQYGFQTVGPNVWVTDVAAYGSITVTAIPEPATAALGGLATAALVLVRRRKN